MKGGADKALPGYKEVQPVVFCGLFPVDAADFEKLRESIGKLRLNDASFSFEMPKAAPRWASASARASSACCTWKSSRNASAREYDLDLITTAPSVVYRIQLNKSRTDPDARSIDAAQPRRLSRSSAASSTIEEPWIKAVIYTPDEYLGAILKLCQDRRGIQVDLTYVGGRAQVTYELPLNEVVFDFYDRLKSISRGYASFDYEQIGLPRGRPRQDEHPRQQRAGRRAVADRPPQRGEERGRGMCERLKDLIPRHLFKIPIQAAIGGKVIARETIAALRKDVTAKCYGGDITRKKKLLEKQKKGKARMREYGNVSIPQEAFIAALRMGEE